MKAQEKAPGQERLAHDQDQTETRVPAPVQPPAAIANARIIRAVNPSPIVGLLEGTAAIGTFQADLEAGTVEWSDEIFRRYAIEPSGDVSMTEAFQRIHPDDRARLAQAVSEGIASGAGYALDFRIISPGDEVFWNSVRANVSGSHVYGIVFDITAIKQAEEERTRLRAAVEQLRLIEDAVNAGTWVFDIESGISHWPPGISALWGLPPKQHEIALPEFVDRIHSEDRERVSKVIGQAVENGSAYHVEFRVVWPDGSIHWLQARGAVMHDSAGRPTQVVGIALEATQQIKTEEALRQSEKLAAAGRLAATIAHEINNPLEAVTNLLYISSQHPSLPAEVRDYLQQADQELARVSHIARQTLGFYRESANPEDVNLADSVNQVLALYRKKIANKNVSVNTKLDESVRVRGSMGELRQMISNIILNAMDAVGNQGCVTVKLRQAGNEVVFTVADNGPGIRKEDQAKIFQPFFTTKKDVGTGLGLWVTKGIVEKHGGRILMRSTTTPQKSGTTFAVKFPIAAASHATP
jgi:PAS domain S-box-containing protein